VEDASLLSQLGLQTTSDKVEQPVRQYKWGQAYALNREHSDLIVLKRLLLGDRVDSLYAMLDESYKRYVAFCDQYEDAGQQLPLIVQVRGLETSTWSPGFWPCLLLSVETAS
jgi:hypothetical protein